MAREDARNCHDFSKMIRLFSVVSLLTFQGAVAQRVKVEAEVVSYPSQTVTLRCAFTDAGGIQLTQVSWIYEPKDGTRTNIAVFHPNFGPNYPTSPLSGRVSFTANPPILSSPSIQISNVQMTDEGKYVCEFATYPSGNEQGIISLVMLAKPRNSASEVTVMAPAVATGAQPVVVARCVSADGRPAAQITWVTTVNGKATTVSTAGSNNTVNVTSEYMLVPTPDDNGKDISCVVSHRTQSTPQSIPLKLAIEHLPQVTITGYDNNWYIGRSNAVLTCEASANPIPTTFTWKTLTGVMPNNVVVNEKVLNVPNVDELVNTTFICEAQNRLGTGKDQLTVLVRVPTPSPVHELKQLQQLLDIEREKGALRDETIKILKEEKAFLQRELSIKDDIIRQIIHMKKEQSPCPSTSGVKQTTLAKSSNISDLTADDASDETSPLSASSLEQAPKRRPGKRRRSAPKHSPTV